MKITKCHLMSVTGDKYATSTIDDKKIKLKCFEDDGTYFLTVLYKMNYHQLSEQFAKAMIQR